MHDVVRPYIWSHEDETPEWYDEALLFKEKRKALYEKGYDFNLLYSTESSAGVSRVRGARYAHEIQFGVHLDRRKLSVVKGSQFSLVLVNREGRSLPEVRIGNLFAVQHLSSFRRHLRLGALNYQQSFAGGAVENLAGRTSVSDHFANSTLVCYFQDGDLCGRPGSLSQNGGFSTFPLSAWGGRVQVKPLKGASYIRAGAFEVDLRLADRKFLHWGFGGDTGAVFPVEFGYVGGDKKAGTQGHVMLGGFYDTSNVADLARGRGGRPVALSGELPRGHPGRFSAYLMADQAVARFGGDPKRTLTVLAGGTIAPSDRSKFRDLVYGGVLAKGLFAARPGDTLGLLALSGRITPNLADDQRLRRALGGSVAVQGRKTVFEATYDLALAPWLHIAPGVQHIAHPAADARRASVTVIDLTTQISF